MHFLQKFKHLDWWFFILIVLLISIGFVVIYSATWGESGIFLNKIKVQIIAAVIGFGLFFLASFLDYRILQNYRFLVFILMILVLVLVLVSGATIRGAKSWISFGPLQFQPSEISKVLLIICLAAFFAKHQERINQFRVIFMSGLILLVPVALIIFEHDLGAAIIMVAIWLGMLITAGLKGRYILFLLAFLSILSLLAWFIFLVPYQKARILSFFNPLSDPLGRSYNLIQSMIAVGSGGLFGKGLGHGSQSQLNFLPERHTDFIFAVTAEEFGFVGGVITLSLFLFLILRILKISRFSSDFFGSLLTFGVAILIVSQVVINIGMNIGILPIAGITLPLISYGGSSLISILFALGIVESVYVSYYQAFFKRES